MNTYLVFDTYEKVYIANAIISLNMRLTGNITIQYETPQQRLTDSKYVIQKPDNVDYMQYVSGYVEEEYSSDWFGQGE